VSESQKPASIGRSAWALLAGALVGLLPTVATDGVLHAVHVFPSLGQPMADQLLALATAYRAAFGVLGSYATARLAPNRPMMHALILGVIGTIACLVGAVVTWNMGLGAHWYPLALVVLAMPQSWLGGKWGSGSCRNVL
jgi:hypothetical protein